MRINIFYTTCSILKNRKNLLNLCLTEKIICVNIIKNVESFYKDDGNLKKTGIYIDNKNTTRKKQIN